MVEEQLLKNSLELLVLGFSVGASFGPVNLMVLKNGFSGGIKNSLSASIGAILGDAFLLLACAYISNIIHVSASSFDKHLKIFASLILFLLAIFSLFQSKDYNNKYNKKRIFYSVFLITIINPLGIFLWSGVAIYFLTMTDFKLYFSYCLIILGDVTWFVVFLFVIHYCKAKLEAKHQRFIGVLSDIIIIIYAINLGYSIID